MDTLLGKKARAAIEDLRRRYYVDPQHTTQVCRLALALFHQTMELHGLAPQARELLEAGALLHDLGRSQGDQGHHKRSRDLILEHGLPGFPLDELRTVACLARYHRKADPDPGHRSFNDLPEQLQEIVRRLAAILRIADGLDRAHESTVEEIRAEAAPGGWRIAVRQTRPSRMDIWGAERKAGLFEAVFGVKTEIAAE